MTDRREELQKDIERTRQQLGETVDALAQKADVPGRVKESAHEASERVKATAAEAAQKARAQTEETVAKLTDATNQAVDALPDPVAAQVENARRHPALVGAVLAALVLLLWRLARRNR